MNNSFDLIVVGGGILGSFHAYHALKGGLKVALFEKNSSPQSATVRNFGQIVPSGMNTKWQQLGRASLEIYKEIQSQFDISLRQQGTIYLASDPKEKLLLEELAEINSRNDYNSYLMTKEECLANYPGLRADYAVGGLYFPDEATIEPQKMIGLLHKYMQQLGLELFLNHEVIECHALSGHVNITTAFGRLYSAAKVVICNGSDFKTLYPDLFMGSELEVVKLQMMQTGPQLNYKLKGSLLSGLSVRRYESFQECPSFNKIKAAESLNNDLIAKWGIHILFKQAVDGSVIIGDSHEYFNVSEIEDPGFKLNMDIDTEILKEAKKILNLTYYDIRYRWTGLYSQCRDSDLYQNTIDGNIHIITGIGGKGMTGSAGFSGQNISDLFNI